MQSKPLEYNLKVHKHILNLCNHYDPIYALGFPILKHGLT